MKELVICTEDKITELPFWLIDHNGKRDSLFLREISTNAIQIETQQQIIGRIDSSQQENRIEQLNNILKQSGFCIRPKAVTLTLFVRLFLADFFIHGIGGARYEAVTDYLLENFFNCPLLTFGTVTMTMKLDLEKWHNNPAEILREINNSPEDFISEHVFDNYKVRKLIKTKKEMITAAADKDKSKLQRRSAWEKITDINKELISYVDVEYKEIISKLTKCESSKEVLEYREFFFGLFEEDVLREVFN
jgi:hypothetical protein